MGPRLINARGKTYLTEAIILIARDIMLYTLEFDNVTQRGIVITIVFVF